ncbi:golgin subfamily A member 4 isoform X3 [Drosophila innubila]|uniref:golgin subfamily A member 4 isoform X3 n=1 Tax=Drosophila innubila TaxID=198719 RepID=UPI00148BC25E|nr:golgin subfamily A member 4 isoform X3 [Drosophila innubila]
MELRVWKLLLLQWAKECNFIEEISTIEDSDIEAFYAVYVQHAQVKPRSDMDILKYSTSLGSLNIFLRDIYPDFIPNLDRDGRVSRKDYIFVYTLLMHYACVQNPSKYFHNICEHLPETVQQCIAAFLQQTVNKPDLTRDYLHETIVNVRSDVDISSLDPLPLSLPATCGRSISNDSSCCSSAITTVNAHGGLDGFNSLSGSNIRDLTTIDNEASGSTKSLSLTPVPQERLSTLNDSQIFAPPTPKTELLEQRTRELLGLRAQLETERYEKTVLEEKILENEHLIKSLSRENNVKKMQLSKLKATVQNENNEEDIYMDNYLPNEFENLKRRLMKELSNRNADLAAKNEQLQELRAEHGVVVDKLKISEKQFVTCMDQLVELESHVQNSTQLLSDKENEIASLLRDKLELQQCLQETRNELYNGREVLNASSDLLDTSQLHSSMNTTPENLATSVIDKQLREKEQENDQLCEQLALNAQEKARIVEELLQIVQKFHLEIPTTPDKSETRLLFLIKHNMEQMSFNYEKEQKRTKELQAQYNTMLHQNIVDEDHIQKLKNEVDKLNLELAESNTNLLSKNKTLQQYEKEFEDKLSSIRQELENKDRELVQINRELTDASSLNSCLDTRINNEMDRWTQCNNEKIELKHQLDIQKEDRCLEMSITLKQLRNITSINGQLEEELQASIENSNKKQEENIVLQKKLEDAMQELCKQKIEHTRVIQNLMAINESHIQLEKEAKTTNDTSNDQRNQILLLEQKLELASQQLCVQNLEREHIEKELKAAKINEAQLKTELNASIKKKIEFETAKIQLEKQVDSMRQALKERKHEQEQSLVESEKQLRQLQDQIEQTELQRDEQLSDVRKLLLNEEKKSELLEKQLNHMEVKFVASARDMKDILSKKEEENQKIETQLNLTTKRLEKLSIKLGEQQAALSKKQRDVAQAKLLQDEQTDIIRTLKHEKENLQLELRQNKERVKRAEDKLISLEQQRSSEETELVAKNDLVVILQKKLKSTEMKMCKLNQDLSLAEKEKVRLSLDIGGLNSEIQQYQKRTVELSEQLQLFNEAQALDKNSNVEKFELSNMQQQLDGVKLQLSEVLQELDSTRLMHTSVQCELDEKNHILKTQREQSVKLEAQHKQITSSLQKELDKCYAELTEIRKSRDELLDTLHKSQEQITQHQAKAQQLELNCQILQAKYRDAKEEISHFDQKLKDQRLEMEGKLEKMKIKMRTLYKAEVTRMKEKQERDAASGQSELDKHSAQNIKYEEHTRKLSNQIVRLNEKILEQQKQYAVLSTKLRHFQEADHATANSSANEEWQPFKRPSAPSSNLGSNLAMEDEEGEIFNNTYLTDLKLGRVPDMTAEELQYRNSMQPPHLKSAYAAQYDLGTQEDDLKDCQLSLDDSMSTLLCIKGGNAVGARKKSMGTHYKRPGPPTPSKNGGRLSFGSSDPPREILREAFDHNCTVKTPARFKMFASRFSMGSSGIGGGHFLPRDEQRRHRQRNLLSGVQRRNLKLRASGAFCTSTPRKSRPYNDLKRKFVKSDPLSEDQSGLQQKDGTPHLSTAELLTMTYGHERKLSTCRRQSVETPRTSFCLHGNIIAKTRTRIKFSPKEQLCYQRTQQRSKIRQQRFECFDQARRLSDYDSECEEQEVIVPSQENSAGYALYNDNNNYSTHNKNYSLMVTDTTLQLEKLSINLTECHLESSLDQSLNAAATFNIASVNSAATCSNWMGMQQPSVVKALVATYDYKNITSPVLQHFEEDQACTWQTDTDDQSAVQPCLYRNTVVHTQEHNQNETPLSLDQQVNSNNNLTVSCTTNSSSRQSWTTHSLGHIQSHRLPSITVNTIQALSDVQETPNRMNLWCRQWHCMRLNQRSVMLIVLALFLSLFYFIYDKVVLAITLALLLLLSTYYFFSK